MCLYREYFEKLERDSLAPYAVRCTDPHYAWRRTSALASGASQPKEHWVSDSAAAEGTGPGGPSGIPDPYGQESRYRTAFQIDGDRVLGSKAFRRMEHKTQIFVSHVGDHYRTRLTHTLEVAELSGLVAQALRLNGDLVQAIALAHDVGHTPSGHFGEGTLDKLLKSRVPSFSNGKAGFFHNIHGVRVVDFLERGYEWDFAEPRAAGDPPDVSKYLAADPSIARGLDLTWAVREGILKHTRRGFDELSVGLLGYDYLREDFELDTPGSLEAQVVRWADDLASMMHDLEDGMRSGLIDPGEIIGHFSGKNGTGLFDSSESLADSLGMSAKFGHGDALDQDGKNRLEKYASTHRRLTDPTKRKLKYNIVAFLRSVFLANLIECSHSKVCKVLRQGRWPASSPLDPVDLTGLRQSESVRHGQRLELTIEGPAAPAGRRTCTSRRFVGGGWIPEAQHVDYAVDWIQKHQDPEVPRHVAVSLGGGPFECWPVGSVFLDLSRVGRLGPSPQDWPATHDSSDLIGYSEEVNGLRRQLKSEVIVNRLHASTSVQRMDHKGRHFLTALFNMFHETPEQLSRTSFESYGLGKLSPAELSEEHREAFSLRVVENLQGMTERFMEEEYARLFLPGRTASVADFLDLGDYFK